MTKGHHIRKTKLTGLKAFFRVSAATVLTVAAVASIGVGFASAGASFGNASTTANSKAVSQVVFTESSAAETTVATPTKSEESYILEVAAGRDMTSAIAQIQAEEEAARIAAEEARIADEKAKIEQAHSAQAISAVTGGYDVYGVDWNVGRDAFIETWTVRINNFLAGSNLDGYGETFATAAWENGVDPRWSPAIAGTESTKGANCFMPHNAWGWTGGSWSNWVSAINYHVHGLATKYGYTLTLAHAQKYCPPYYQSWYSTVSGFISEI